MKIGLRKTELERRRADGQAFQTPLVRGAGRHQEKGCGGGLDGKEIIELPHMIIGEINKEIKPRGRNMLNLKGKDIPAAREIAERVLADCISA